MAVCTINNGQDLSCINAIPGVKRIYISTFSAGTTYATNSSNVITGVTSLNSVYAINGPRETMAYTDEATINVQNQSISYAPTVSFKINQMSASVRDKVLLWAKATVIAIAEMQDSSYILLGASNGLTATVVGGQSGQAAGDSNDYHVTFAGYEPELGKFINYSAFSALIVANS